MIKHLIYLFIIVLFCFPSVARAQTGLGMSNATGPLTRGNAFGNIVVGPDNITGVTDLTLTGDLTTSLTEGSIAFIGTDGLLTEDNSNLFWDDVAKQLGIGISNPVGVKLHIVGTTGVNDGKIIIEADDSGDFDPSLAFRTGTTQKGIIGWDKGQDVVKFLYATGISGTGGIIIDPDSNVLIGGTVAGASAIGSFVIYSGTLGAVRADLIQIASEDIATGTAVLRLINEMGGAGTVANVVTKTDTGDGTGYESKFQINTSDNTVKIYADGAWRTIASGW